MRVNRSSAPPTLAWRRCNVKFMLQWMLVIALFASIAGSLAGETNSTTPVQPKAAQATSSGAAQPNVHDIAKADIDAYRDSRIAGLDRSIATDQRMLDQLPEAAQRGSFFARRIDETNKAKQEWLNKTDAEVAAAIISGMRGAGVTPPAKPCPEQAQPAQTTTAFSDQEVDQFRASTIEEFTTQIAQMRKRIFQMPRRGSGARDELLGQIRELSDQLTKVKTASREELRQILVQAQREREQEQAAAQAQREENQRRVAAALQEKFPNWSGPWKTCRVCGGTGRDEIAERRVNDQNASIALGQAAGTTGTRVVGHTAVIPCSVCGGTGLVPDYGR